MPRPRTESQRNQIPTPASATGAIQRHPAHCGYRIDILVEDELIVELKSVDEIKGIHQAQLLTYMKLSGAKIGLLINFNVTKLKDGLKRFVL